MPKFAKRHYITVAEIIRSYMDRSDALTLFDAAYQQTVASMFANVFEHDNPRFNRERFLSACGVSDSVPSR